MALKDWKPTMQDGWTNDKNLHKIRIHYEDAGYSFNLYDKNWRRIKIKNFPYHTQALAFAKKMIKTFKQ